MDPITLSTVSSALAIARTAFGGLGYILGVKGAGVISAHFAADGQRIGCSDKIEVEKHETEDKGAWWFSVKDVKDYTFVRIPLVDSCLDELAGMKQGEVNPDARYWRWTARPTTGVIVDGSRSAPNINVQFIVVGYKPKALLKHFASN